MSYDVVLKLQFREFHITPTSSDGYAPDQC